MTESAISQELQVQEYSNEGGQIVSQLRAIQVIDQESHDHAVDVLVIRATWKKKVVEWFAPMKKKAYDAWKEICAKETEVLEGKDGANEEAETQTRRNLEEWIKKKKEEKEKADLAAAQEQSRKDEESRQTAAAHAKALGAGEEAVQQILEAALPVSPPVTAPTYRKDSRVPDSRRWKWRFASTEKAALSTLVKAAAKNPQLLGLLCINEKALNAKATTEKSTAVVPGIVFYPETKISVRAAK